MRSDTPQTTRRRVSAKGIALIQSFEGFSSTTYLCPAGKPTIGYGHVLKTTDCFNPPITRAEAAQLLADDLATVETYLTGVLPGISQNQFDALAAFAFNCGIGALDGSTLLKLLKAGDVQGAAEQFPLWNKVNKLALPGLTRRRAAERELFLDEQPVAYG